MKQRKDWAQDGNLHRVDGPAIEYANGDKSWYQHGTLVSESDVMKASLPSCEGKVI